MKLKPPVEVAPGVFLLESEHTEQKPLVDRLGDALEWIVSGIVGLALLAAIVLVSVATLVWAWKLLFG